MKKMLFLTLFFSAMMHLLPTSAIISFNEIPKESAELSDEIILFDYIKNAEKPVILKFYADWCAPCRRMIPIVNQVKKYFSDRIIVININVDTHKNLCGTFNIRYLPTFIYFKKDKEIQRTNSINKEIMIQIIQELF